MRTHLIEVSFAMSGDSDENAYLNELRRASISTTSRWTAYRIRAPDMKRLPDRLEQ